MVRFRDAIRAGRVVLPQNIDRKLKEKILLQGARLPYHYAEAGGLRYVMDKKEVMRSNGISSPDIFDAMSFAWLEDANSYIVAENRGRGLVSTVAGAAKAEADDMFSDVD